MNTFLILFTLTFTSSIIEIPCLKQINGQWKKQQSKCAQYSAKEQREATKRLKQWSNLKKEVKALRGQINTFSKLESLWKRMEELDVRMNKRQKLIIQLEKQRSANCNKALVEQTKLVKRQWYESPILWTTVGLVVGVGATIAIVMAVK